MDVKQNVDCCVQVNQQVLAEVQTRGEDTVDVEGLSREVMGRLHVAGARSKQLKVNKASLAPASDHIKNVSYCSTLAAVREVYDMPEHEAIGFACPPPPEARCSLFGAPPAAGDLGGAMSAMGTEPLSYETSEDVINYAQAERMVQKALRRNNIELAKKWAVFRRYRLERNNTDLAEKWAVFRRYRLERNNTDLAKKWAAFRHYRLTGNKIDLAKKWAAFRHYRLTRNKIDLAKKWAVFRRYRLERNNTDLAKKWAALSSIQTNGKHIFVLTDCINRCFC